MPNHKQIDDNLKLIVESDSKNVLALHPEEAEKNKETLLTDEEFANGPVLEELEEETGLKKSLGLWNGVSFIIGSIIGSGNLCYSAVSLYSFDLGIFIAPTGVQAEAGSVGVSLLIWLVSGIFAAMGAWSYAELGTMIKKSGGDYAYIMEAFGPFIGFMRFWIEAIVVRPCRFVQYFLQSK